MAKKEIGRPQTAHIAPFGLRLQPELRSKLEAAAVENGRSMNAEIVSRLEQSFAATDDRFSYLLGQYAELKDMLSRAQFEIIPSTQTTESDGKKSVRAKIVIPKKGK